MEDYEAYNGEEAGSSGSDKSDDGDDDAEDSDGDEQGKRPQHAKRGAPPEQSAKAKRRRPMNIEYEVEHEMEPMPAMQSMQH